MIPVTTSNRADGSSESAESHTLACRRNEYSQRADVSAVSRAGPYQGSAQARGQAGRPGTSIDEKSGLGIKRVQAMIRNYRAHRRDGRLATLSRHEADTLCSKLGDRLNEHIEANWQNREHPDSVQCGMMDISIYNMTGWILEKWKPAHTFGPVEEWYSFRFQGQAALGSYPIHGEYEFCAGPTPYQPSAEQLENAIHEEIRKAEARPTSARERMVQTMLDIERQQEAQDHETQNQVEAAYKDASVLMNRLSLGAGKVRTELALKAGITEHYGN